MEAATIFIPLQSSFGFNPLSGWLNRLQGIQERSEKVYQEKRKVQKGFENCWVPLFESLHHARINKCIFCFLHFCIFINNIWCKIYQESWHAGLRAFKYYKIKRMANI